MNYSLNNKHQSVFFKLLIILLLSLSVTANAQVDRAQALAAQSRGDFRDAAKLWLQLANNSDPLAQFNLALLYQQGEGVTADENLSGYWFAMAARQGMAEAYAEINSHAIQPTEAPTHAKVMLGPQAWLTAQDPHSYTLQLASSTNKALIQKYYRENNLTGKGGYYRSQRSGEDWYALVYGAYPSIPEAKAAIASLPDDLKKWSPWVRNIQSIRRIMLP